MTRDDKQIELYQDAFNFLLDGDHELVVYGVLKKLHITKGNTYYDDMVQEGMLSFVEKYIRAINLKKEPEYYNAKFGDTITVDVTPAATAALKVAFYSEDKANGTLTALKSSDFAYDYPALTSDAQTTALGKSTETSFTTTKLFGENGPFEKAFNKAVNSYKADAGTLADASKTTSTTGNDKIGFFGQSLNNGTQRYFYVYNPGDTLSNNATNQAKGNTIKVVLQKYVTSTQLPAEGTKDANANTDHIAK